MIKSFLKRTDSSATYVFILQETLLKNLHSILEILEFNIQKSDKDFNLRVITKKSWPYHKHFFSYCDYSIHTIFLRESIYIRAHKKQLIASLIIAKLIFQYAVKFSLQACLLDKEVKYAHL